MAHSEETKKKISRSLKLRSEEISNRVKKDWENQEHRNKVVSSNKKAWEDGKYSHVNWSESAAKGTKGKFKKPKSILEVSKRTTMKILRRLDLGCSRCGWNGEHGDIHHILGRKIESADDHKNLSYLCPNCHRLADRGKIKDELISLQEQVGDKWIQFYYG